MELDCAMYENCTLAEVNESKLYPIKLTCDDGLIVRLSKYGGYSQTELAKCVIFPKGKDTWEGFVPPVEFKAGDIVCTNLGNIVILKEMSGTYYYNTYCGVTHDDEFYLCVTVRANRLATEEEKQRLFKAIEDNGYKWNAEKKCLEKLEPQYPKTYKECCDILGLDTMVNDAQGYKWVLIMRLHELIICRDAYWKIAGEKMRLKKPWKPDYTIDEDGTGLFKFCIKNMGGKIKMVETAEANTILAFPTAEMRDAFYENFKDSIERSKELL